MQPSRPRRQPHWPATIAGIWLLLATPVLAQPTVGLFVNDDPQEGLTLFSPNRGTVTYLINNDGLVVNSWNSPYTPGLMGYLLSNGHLLRTAMLPVPPANFIGAAGASGRVEQFDWEGNLVWGFEYASSEYLSHHDIEPLPGGNVLLIAWEHMTELEAIEAGKNPALVRDALRIDRIVEVQPAPPVGGTIVWQWRARDHLIQDFDPTKDNFGVVGEHPELIDFNAGGLGGDFTHFNGIDYNEEFDQILVSVRGLDEIWVIDHSTTTVEAAGHVGGTYGKGGDLLYRWGNPEVYRRGSVADQQLYGQHDAQWIASGSPGAGNILIYNNGQGRPEGQYSTVDEIVPPVDSSGVYLWPAAGEPFGPETALWSYVADPPTSFYSANISGAQRQPNGNTLICEGASGHLFEVDAGGELAWEYVNPVNANGPLNQGATPVNNSVFKTRRYPFDFPGFDGLDLTPGDPVEGFTTPFPVPAGSLTATRVSVDGWSIDVEWDAASCPSNGYNLIYGDLSSVSAPAINGAECDIGPSGGHLWTGVPAQDLFFLVVGTDHTNVYESSWGQGTDGGERAGTKASFQCGTTTKIVTADCP